MDLSGIPTVTQQPIPSDAPVTAAGQDDASKFVLFQSAMEAAFRSADIAADAPRKDRPKPGSPDTMPAEHEQTADEGGETNQSRFAASLAVRYTIPADVPIPQGAGPVSPRQVNSTTEISGVSGTETTTNSQRAKVADQQTSLSVPPQRRDAASTPVRPGDDETFSGPADPKRTDSERVEMSIKSETPSRSETPRKPEAPSQEHLPTQAAEDVTDETNLPRHGEQRQIEASSSGENAVLLAQAQTFTDETAAVSSPRESRPQSDKRGVEKDASSVNKAAPVPLPSSIDLGQSHDASAEPKVISKVDPKPIAGDLTIADVNSVVKAAAVSKSIAGAKIKVNSPSVSRSDFLRLPVTPEQTPSVPAAPQTIPGAKVFATQNDGKAEYDDAAPTHGQTKLDFSTDTQAEPIAGEAAPRSSSEQTPQAIPQRGKATPLAAASDGEEQITPPTREQPENSAAGPVSTHSPAGHFAGASGPRSGEQQQPLHHHFVRAAVESAYTAPGQAVSAARLLRSPSGVEMRMDFHSDTLGAMHLRAVVGENGLGATIRVADPGAHALLSRELPSLQSALNRSDLQLEHVTISQSSLPGGAAFSGGSDSHASDFAQRRDQSAAGANHTGDTPSDPGSPVSPVENENGRLNVRA